MYLCLGAKVSLADLLLIKGFPVMTVIRLYVFDIPLLGGKSLRNITTCLASSMAMHLVKLGKGRLAWCARIFSLMTFICLSTYGTWSRAPVVLRVVLTTFYLRDWNLGSTNIVERKKI